MERIIAYACHTLRDLDVDVIVVHGPAGCCFMASRSIEEAGVRVVTSGITDNDLVFGAVDSLIETLKLVKEKFDPKTVAVIGTCASMIIGEDLDAAIRRANIGCTVFSVDCHGCMKDNTSGAIKAIEAAEAAGIISHPVGTEEIRSVAMMEIPWLGVIKVYMTESKRAFLEHVPNSINCLIMIFVLIFSVIYCCDIFYKKKELIVKSFEWSRWKYV